MNKMNIGILGAGKMGEALITGILSKNKNCSIFASTRTNESAVDISKRLKIKTTTSNIELVKKSDIIILCVKPHQAEIVLKEVVKYLKSNQLLISTCASITTSEIRKWTKDKVKVIRTMPNTPCLINEGMTAISPASNTGNTQVEIADQIFSTVGKTAIVEEHLMDGVTGLSGCGPAYVYLMIEALSEAGVKVGLSRKVSTLLAAQTLLGSSKMVIDKNIHPAELKDEVTTPAGCTIDGLMALEEGKVRIALIKAVVAATNRSKNLK